MLKIKITATKSILDGIVLKEPVCIDTLNSLIRSSLLVVSAKDSKTTVDERKQLRKYKNLIQGGVAEIRYSRKMKYGRVYADGSVGIFPLRWVLRHTLAAKVGFGDYDIVCCHPTILLQLCEANGLECSKLREYVNQREEFLSRIMEAIPLFAKKRAEDRDIVKNLPLRIMYLGGLQNWATDYGLMPDEIPEWLFTWCDEMLAQLTAIADHIIKENPKLTKEVTTRQGSDSGNLKAAILSYFIQEYECRILETVYVYCCEKEYIRDNVCVLCLDGIMLEEANIPPATILAELSAIVLKKTGFKIKFAKKAFEYALTDEQIESAKITDAVLDKSKLDRFDTTYFGQLDDYDIKKMYFEKFVCKILRPDPTYIYIEKDSDIKETTCFYSQEKIKNTFCHLGNFIGLWLDDETIKLYNKMDFLPYNETHPLAPHLFNLFRGFNPLRRTPFLKTQQEKILKPFMDLNLQLCGGDEKHSLFLLKYYADIIQHPDRKNPLAFIIKGKQGTGKNVALDAVGRVIDSAHYITSSNPKDFFGDYAEGFYHKLLVNLNECEGKDTFDFEGRIKSFITEDTITLNRKFVQPITISNLARIIITTNKSTPIPIDVRSKERRYVVYETTDHYLDAKYTTKFWLDLIAHFKKPIFIAALYDYLNTLDISKTDWRCERPITTAYLQMCKLFVPTEVLFLADFIEERAIKNKQMIQLKLKQEQNKTPQFDEEGDPPEEPDLIYYTEDYMVKNGIKGEHFYNDYMLYCKRYGFYKDTTTYLKNIKSFYHKISELGLPIISCKPGGAIHFRFKMSEVLKIMKEKKWIDRDEKEEDIIAAETPKELTPEQSKEFEDYFSI